MFQVVLFSILISELCALRQLLSVYISMEPLIGSLHGPGNIAAELHPRPPCGTHSLIVFFDCLQFSVPAVRCFWLVCLFGWVLFCFCFVQLQIRGLPGQLWVRGHGVQVFPQAVEEQESYLSRSPFLHVKNVGKDDNSSRLSRGIKTVLVGT